MDAAQALFRNASPCAFGLLALLCLGQPLYAFVSAAGPRSRACSRVGTRLQRVRLRRAFGERAVAEGMDPQARWPTSGLMNSQNMPVYVWFVGGPPAQVVR